MDTRFGEVNARFGDLKADRDTRFGEVNARFADLAMSLNSRIDRVDGRITGVEGRLGEQIESVRQDVRDVRHDVREVRQEVRGMRSELRGVIDGPEAGELTRRHRKGPGRFLIHPFRGSMVHGTHSPRKLCVEARFHHFSVHRRSRQMRHPYRFVPVAALAASIFAATAQTPIPAHAQQAYDEALWGSLDWRNVGPPRGGRSIAARGLGRAPLRVLHGHDRRRALEDHRRRPELGSGHRRADEQRLDRCGAGLREQPPTSSTWGPARRRSVATSSRGDGAYKSTDAGETWEHIGLTETQNIARIRIHPENCDIAWVAAFGKHSANNPERGIFKTTDGGQTWRNVLFKSDGAGGVDISVDVTNPDIIYAAIWEAWRRSWGMSSGGEDSGPVQVHRRRRELERDHRQHRAGGRAGRQDRGGGFTGEPEPRLGADRARARRRGVALGRRRRDLGARQRGAQTAAARLLLHARLRGPERRGRDVRPQHGAVPVARRGRDLPARHPGAARRQPRPVDRPRRLGPDDQRQRRRRQRHLQRGRELDRPGLLHRAVLSRDHDRAHAVPHLRRPAGQLHRVHSRARVEPDGGPWPRQPHVVLRPSAAARAATWPPIRSTSTSSTRAATAAPCPAST